MDDPSNPELASGLLRALRGRRSQAAFNRRLGFASNVAYTWESGRRFPTATTFLRVARLSGVAPAEALTRFAPGVPAPADAEDAAQLAAWLDTLRGTTTVSEVARRARRGRAAVARWLSGAAQPRLPDLLLLVEALTDRVLDFVAAFVDPSRVPAAAERWVRVQGARALASATPWTAAVLLALDLEAYRGQPAPEWIADRLRISPALAGECLDLLARAGLVRRVDGRWVRARVGNVDTRSAADLRGFWADVARSRLGTGSKGLQAWSLGLVSEADLARIARVQREAFRTVRGIVGASAPAERVVLLSWSLVPLDEAG